MKKLLSILIISCVIMLNISAFADSYVMHSVKPGDSYWKISNEYNISMNNLMYLNQDQGDLLYVGNLIKLSPLSDHKKITIKVNDELISYDQEPYIENSRTFVPIRFIAEALNVNEIIWDGDNNTAILKNDSKTIKLPIGSNYSYINGEAIKLDAPISVYNQRTFVPLRFVAEAFDSTVKWDQDNYIVDIFNNNDSTDLLWLARIVEAEAEGEPYEGKLAVANVIINRKNNDEFPNTIKDVIFDTKFGVQFTPVTNGKIYNNPSSESLKAAKNALEGQNNISNSLYFLNPDKANSSWIIDNRSFYTTISNHNFYK